MRQITELHNHSEYSQLRMLDCPVKVKDLIYRAVELECSGLALTDHETISGHVKAIQTVKDGKKNGKIPEDFKLILGNEIYLIDEIITDFEERKSVNTPFYHFILLAKDEIGNEHIIMIKLSFKNVNIKTIEGMLEYDEKFGKLSGIKSNLIRRNNYG